MLIKKSGWAGPTTSWDKMQDEIMQWDTKPRGLLAKEGASQKDHLIEAMIVITTWAVFGGEIPQAMG